MKRQRVPVSSLDPTRPLLFHQQSLASVTGSKQPYQLIFPDQTTSIGLPVESELRQIFADSSPVSRLVSEETEEPVIASREEIIIVCTPPVTPVDINSEMSFFTFFLSLQVIILSFWSSALPWFFVIFAFADLLFFLAVALRSVQGVGFFRAAQAAATVGGFCVGASSMDLAAVVLLNLPLLSVGERVERKLANQILISSSE